MPNGSIIVTGATGSMGRAAVRALALKGESVIAVCRSRAKGAQLLQDIKSELPDADVDLAIADLSSIASVKALADSMESRDIKGLFNNAGTLLRDYTLSVNHLEMCVAVNYVAPYILCERLAEQMSPGDHIVNMVSLTARFPDIDRDFFAEGQEKYSQLGTYAKSKLALLLYTKHFAEIHPDLHVNMSDPGVVNSNMIKMDRWFDPLADKLFRPFCKTPEKGVSPALRALYTLETCKLFIGDNVKEIPPRYSRYGDLGWLWDETRRIVENA